MNISSFFSPSHLSFSLFLSLSLYLVFGLVRLEDLALGEEERSGEQQEKEHGCFSLEHQVRLFDSSFGGSLYGSFLCASVKCSAPDKTKGQCPWGSSWHLQPLLFLVSGGVTGSGGRLAEANLRGWNNRSFQRVSILGRCVTHKRSIDLLWPMMWPDVTSRSVTFECNVLSFILDELMLSCQRFNSCGTNLKVSVHLWDTNLFTVTQL